MRFQDQLIKFKSIELSKMNHKFDKAIVIDIKPFSFKSVQKRPVTKINFNEVYMMGVVEKVFDIFSWNIPEIIKTSKDFKKIFIESFYRASASKHIALGDYVFYPNFSEFAYKMDLNLSIMENIQLSEIDKFVCKKIIGNIPELINEKCISKFGPDYGKKSLVDFANEFPKLNQEIQADVRSKNRKAS